MPVSTRAQSGPRQRPAVPETSSAPYDPHRGLKEKMKALTSLYEQKFHSSAAPAHHPSVDLFDSGSKKKETRHAGGGIEARHAVSRVVMSENLAPLPGPSKPAKHLMNFPRGDAKENYETSRRLGHTEVHGFPKRDKPAPVIRPGRLSIGAQHEVAAVVPKKVAAEARALGGSRIMVFVRLRPMSRKEKEAGARCCVRIVNASDVYLTEFALEHDYLRLTRVRGRHFCFDAAFLDPTTQHQVYTATTAELVEGVLQGRNASVFCYGATGAGKTYTMLGTTDNPGVMVLAIKDLFSKIRQRSYDGNHLVHLSYLEVYNETVRDLLSPGRPLVLREDKQGIVAAGLTQYRAYSTEEVMVLLQQGNQNRTTEPTRANETSSRSHAILQVVAEFKLNDSGNVVGRIGKLSLIDLAGSERALATDLRTQRSIEGANINRSLLALSSCINALVEGKKHIPYRNSKLTQLLKDSLGGPCNTVMIANISPSNLSFGETQNTLHWADRAKEIKTKECMTLNEAIQLPESVSDQAKLLLDMQRENGDLRQQLVFLQKKLLSVQGQLLVANSASSPAIAAVPQLFSSPCTQHKAKRSLLSGSCFNTPESKKKENYMVQELQRTLKTLEADVEKMKKEHATQLKQKDDFIRDLIIKKGNNVVVTRANLRKELKATTDNTGELKSPKLRFVSPAPGAKKRSFWDITAANSPAAVSVNSRKTRSHVASDTSQAPSMLLQPGFARYRSDTRT